METITLASKNKTAKQTKKTSILEHLRKLLVTKRGKVFHSTPPQYARRKKLSEKGWK
jgi:hypothetical protein